MKKHDSYGAISLSRMSSTGMNLFGSSINNTSPIALRINEAEEDESYGSTKHRQGKRIIEVYMSPNQYAELITTMSLSEGVPCTINWMQGKGSIENPPRINKREVTERFVKETLGDLLEKLHDIQEFASLLKKKSSVSKKDREKLSFDLRILEEHLESNIPFIEDIFREVMDKVVTEAKSDIDAFVTHAITELGLEALESKRKLIE